MKNNGVPIVKEGLPFLFIALVASIAFWIGGIWPLSVLFVGLTLFIAFFFRNPERLAPVGAHLVCSPADGKVIFIGVVKENEFLKEEMQKISVFMSLWDVHVNRVPIDGTIKNMKHHRGRFMAAFEDRASEENERNCMLLETSKGVQLVLVQVAGLVARRIICYPGIGAFLLKGQRFGLIRFGSRCDMYFPKEAVILVKIGQKVMGGETLLAELKG
ncbi:MAG: phosphatidylserine decarboxylase family protein [Deltaproteobacteria bacterium]|nr:phosphatidylserine decarboxylase family protein [Deltaproteobacteria bacterium]